MPKTKKWSKERRRIFEAKREAKKAAERNPVPPIEQPTDNLVAPRPQSPFMRLSNELARFHSDLQIKLHDLADVFRF
jgi:hypothetical protein